MSGRRNLSICKGTCRYPSMVSEGSNDSDRSMLWHSDFHQRMIVIQKEGKRMIQAIVLAFSTYSRIPMPKAKWDDKGMKYCICAFPLVGVVIGLLQMALWYGFVQVWKLDHMLVAISMTVLPLVVTGGIHMDGYLDTMDARMSYQPMEKKLQILKDPHMGAFACIKGAVYLLLYLGICSQFLVKVKTMDIQDAWKMMIAYGMVFVYTRILSGLGVEVFRKAKKDGMVAQLSRQSDKTVIAILGV